MLNFSSSAKISSMVSRDSRLRSANSVSRVTLAGSTFACFAITSRISVATSVIVRASLSAPGLRIAQKTSPEHRYINYTGSFRRHGQDRLRRPLARQEWRRRGDQRREQAEDSKQPNEIAGAVIDHRDQGDAERAHAEREEEFRAEGRCPPARRRIMRQQRVLGRGRDRDQTETHERGGEERQIEEPGRDEEH